MNNVVAFVDRLKNEWPKPNHVIESYPLMSSYWFAVLPPLAYLAAIWLLRGVMARRKTAIEVPRWFQALHNLALVVLSAYMSFNLLREAWRSGYGLVCNPVVPGPKGKPVCF